MRNVKVSCLYGGGIIVLITAVVLMIVDNWLPTYKEELVKLALQLLVVGVVGGVAQYVLDLRSQERAFRHDMLEQLGRVHKALYRVRRLYAIAVGDERRHLLGELMDARQDLGAILHTVRQRDDTTFKVIKGSVDEMRAYLEQVITAVIRDIEGTREPALDAFVAWQDSGEATPYAENFKRHFESVRSKVVVSLIGNRSDKPAPAPASDGGSKDGAPPPR